MQDGKPMAFYDGVVGGRSVGAPGTVRALALAHGRYGSCPGPRCSSPPSPWRSRASSSARASPP